MAIYTPNIATNLGSANFDVNTNTPTIHATTNLTLSTGGLFTATFTAPNTTNKSTGAWVCLATTKTSGDLTITLQESTVDTAATVTILSANLPAGGNNQWVYVRWATPYTFTTTTAGAYRLKVRSSVANGTIAADSGGTLVAYMHTDNRSATPASTDDLWLGGINLSATAYTYTGVSNAFGSGADSAAPTTTQERTVGHALLIAYNATLTADTSVNTALQPKGNIVVKGGTFNIGSSGTPLPSAVTSRIDFNATIANAPFGLVPMTTGKINFYGSTLSYIQTTLSSGLGTAASPLVTTDPVDWSVGDEIWVAPTDNTATNYNNGEYRFIITKNSSTSYVLSSTSGGTENTLSANHATGALIAHLSRNIIISANNTTNGTYVFNNTTVLNDFNYSYVRAEYMGSVAAAGNRQGFALAASGASSTCNLNYCVSYKSNDRGFWWQSSAVTETFTGLISIGSTQYGIYSNGGNNKTYTDCLFLACLQCGFGSSLLIGTTFTRCKAIACGISNTTPYGFFMTSATNCQFNSCEAHANRGGAMQLNSITASTATNLLSGTKGINSTTDILVSSGTYNLMDFISSTFSSTNLISGYTSGTPGSLIRFHKLNVINNNHKWYTSYGSAQATGASLADTTVRTASSLGVRMSPENASTGFTWAFNIPAKNNSIVGFTGYFQRSSAFSSGTATVSLYLPGNDYTIASNVADASYTLPTTTGAWLPVNISASYSGGVDGLGTIVINAQTATASAYLYADDFYNAGDGTTTFDKVTGLDVWDKGQPISIIAPQTPSAADIAANVLDAQLSAHVSNGTVGLRLNQVSTKGDLASFID